MFVVDSSTKTDSSAWTLILQFINQLIDQYYVGQNLRFAFVRYSNQANVIFNLNQYSDANSVKAAVLRVQQVTGGSNPAAVYDVFRTQILPAARGQGYWKVVLLITDQLQRTAALSQALANLQRSVDNWFRLHGVGIAVSGRTLDTSALSPYQVTSVNGYRALSNSVQSLHSYICPTDISPTTTTPSPAPGESIFFECCLH